MCDAVPRDACAGFSADAVSLNVARLIAYEEADDTMRRKLFEDVHAKFKEEHVSVARMCWWSVRWPSRATTRLCCAAQLSSLEAQMRVQCATSCDEITLKYNRRAKREARKAVDALEAHRAAWACPRRAIEIVYVGWGELALRVVKWARWLCSGMWWPWRGAPKVGKARTA